MIKGALVTVEGGAAAGTHFDLEEEKQMRKMVILGILSLLFLLPVALVAACQQQPEPAPPSPVPVPPTTPAPAPTPIPAPTPTPQPLPLAVDEPKLSEDEVCALIWNRIPSQLPDGYSKNDLSKDTRMAEYEGDGKWLFSVSGNVRQEGPVTTETVKAEDYWVDRDSCEVTSYELHLIAVYYENTQTLDISVEKQNEQVMVETSDTPILRKEIKLKWMTVKGTAHHYYLEGSIENIGKIPVVGLSIEFFLYDEDDNLLRTEKCKITPDPIPSGERGKFKHDFVITGKSFSFYDCRFILETGEVFEYLEGSGEEEPVFFYEVDMKGT